MWPECRKEEESVKILESCIDVVILYELYRKFLDIMHVIFIVLFIIVSVISDVWP